jgi:hypothetical protein
MTKVRAGKVKGVRVAHVCRTGAGLPQPSPMDDRRDMVRWEGIAQRDQGTRTLGFFEWSLAV